MSCVKPSKTCLAGPSFSGSLKYASVAVSINWIFLCTEILNCYQNMFHFMILLSNEKTLVLGSLIPVFSLGQGKLAWVHIWSILPPRSTIAIFIFDPFSTSWSTSPSIKRMASMRSVSLDSRQSSPIRSCFNRHLFVSGLATGCASLLDGI